MRNSRRQFQRAWAELVKRGIIVPTDEMQRNRAGKLVPVYTLSAKGTALAMTQKTEADTLALVATAADRIGHAVFRIPDEASR
jgi:hypothetical protein